MGLGLRVRLRVKVGLRAHARDNGVPDHVRTGEVELDCGNFFHLHDKTLFNNRKIKESKQTNERTNERTNDAGWRLKWIVWIDCVDFAIDVDEPRSGDQRHITAHSWG